MGTAIGAGEFESRARKTKKQVAIGLFRMENPAAKRTIPRE